MWQLLADAAQSIQAPEKMPENAGQTVIYFAITCLVCIIGMVWFLLRRDTSEKIVAIFSESLGETQKTFKEEAVQARQAFKEESDAARAAHSIIIDKILVENRVVHQEQGRLLEKAVGEHGRLLEKSVDRITSSLDDLKGDHPQPRKRPPANG